MQVWVHCARHGIVPSAVTSEIVVRRGVAEEITEPSPHDLLADLEIFAALDTESRRILVGGMNVRVVPKGDQIVRQGGEGSSLFVISSGLASVLIETADGMPEEVAKLGAGQYFGEMSLLAGEPRSATVVAHTECHLLEIGKDALKPVFDRHPELMEAVARIITERRLSNEALEREGTDDDFASRLTALAANFLDRMRSIFA